MSEIKQAFPSRFEEGVLVEMDFSQLEVIGLAMLSLDPVLISDLDSGMDMHRLRASELFNKTEEEVTDSERRITKQLSFQLQYGAGATSMAAKLDIKKAIAKQFIENYYGRYSRVKDWQEEVIEAIKRSRKPTNERLPSGLPRGRGEWESPTGRLYVFMEQDGYEGREPSFNPPTMKNYPIQGFATGDVMAVYRAMVYRYWLNSEFRYRVLPINTVHDSVMFDCVDFNTGLAWRQVLEFLAHQLVEKISESWPDIATPLPFKIETKLGPTWSAMRKV